MPQILEKARLGRLNALERMRHGRAVVTPLRPCTHGAKSVLQFSTRRFA